MTENRSLLNKILPLFIVLVIVVTLAAIDAARGVYNDQNTTKLTVFVTDLNGRPVAQATVTVIETGQKSVTDAQGRTQPIAIRRDSQKKYDWFCVTVTIRAENFVDTVIFDCVIYDNMTRYVTVRIYPVDSSPLPYVAYTEIPPEEFILSLFEK